MHPKVYLFIRRFNQVALIFSLLLIIDFNLPLSSERGVLEDYHRPTVGRRAYSSRATKSSDELILHTSVGSIKVNPWDLGPDKKNAEIVLKTTRILSVPKKIILMESNKLINSNNFLFGYFVFLPWLVLFLSAITLKTKRRITQLNIGSANIVLLILLLFLLMENSLR